MNTSKNVGRHICVILRRVAAACSLLAMTSVFLFPAAARWCGWLPKLQLVPAILAGAVLELVVLAILVALFGRLYCSILCPLGIVQDLFRFCFGWILPRRTNAPAKPAVRIVRLVVLALFLLAIPVGFTGLVEPYGIFGRFLSVGVLRCGDPATVTVVWALALFAVILLLTLVRSRFWCNRICPVGTFLGILARFSVFRVRIDGSKCVKCGLCAKRCAVGALTVRDDKSVAVDASSCVMCGNCGVACRPGALKF